MRSLARATPEHRAFGFHDASESAIDGDPTLSIGERSVTITGMNAAGRVEHHVYLHADSGTRSDAG